jgi:hypothetical protein
MGVLPSLVHKYNGNATRLFFDEGGAVRGPALESPIYAHAVHKLRASVAEPFFSRPGHWGVFHLARFEVGPELWRIMRNAPFHHPEFAKYSRNSLAKLQKAGRGARSPQMAG